MPMEGPGFQKLLPKQLIKEDLVRIIYHLENIISQCTDITKTKSFAAWVIDRDIWWIFYAFFGEQVCTLKPEDRLNGYTLDKDPTERVRN